MSQSLPPSKMLQWYCDSGQVMWSVGHGALEATGPPDGARAEASGSSQPAGTCTDRRDDRLIKRKPLTLMSHETYTLTHTHMAHLFQRPVQQGEKQENSVWANLNALQRVCTKKPCTTVSHLPLMVKSGRLV